MKQATRPGAFFAIRTTNESQERVSAVCHLASDVTTINSAWAHDSLSTDAITARIKDAWESKIAGGIGMVFVDITGRNGSSTSAAYQASRIAMSRAIQESTPIGVYVNSLKELNSPLFRNESVRACVRLVITNQPTISTCERENVCSRFANLDSEHVLSGQYMLKNGSIKACLAATLKRFSLQFR